MRMRLLKVVYMPGVHYLEDTAHYAQCAEPPTLTLSNIH